MNFYKRIIIIEDDQELRDYYRIIIKSVNKYHFIDAYASWEAAFSKLKKDKPDIILMNIKLGGGVSGIEVTKLLKLNYPYIEVLFISDDEDRTIILDAFRAGAFGCICKKSTYLELVGALDEISNGGAPMSLKIARMVVNEFHSNPNSPLSEREKEVLRLVSQGKSYSQIADDLFISKETSKTHIKNIYGKLEVNSKSEALELATANKYF